MREKANHSHRASRVAALALMVALIGMGASLTQVGFALEEELGLGWLFQLRGPRPAPADAFVVRFDRDTFARLRALPEEPERWPEPLRGCAANLPAMAGLPHTATLDRLPRGFHACLARELTRRGASVLAFDISFRNDPLRAEGVTAFAEAMREHGRVVLLERAVRNRTRDAALGGAGASVQADRLEGPDAALTAAAIGTAPFLLPRTGNQVHQFWAFNPAVATATQLPVRVLETLAFEPLHRFALALGREVGAELGPAERLLRLVELYRQEGHRLTPGLAMVAGLSRRELDLLAALARVHNGPEAYYLNFYGPPGSFLSISAADLLLPDSGYAADPRLADLEGRAAFIGYAELAETGATDSFPTAFSRDGIYLSGVEIAATAFANLLHGQTLRPLPEWLRLLLVGLLGGVMIAASCMGRVWRGLALTLALALAYAGLAAGAFVVGHVWFPVVVPLLLLLPLAIGLGQLVHYLGAARWLTIYTPRSVGQHLLHGHEVAARASQRREVTVMMTDIAGFTPLAEHSSPEAMTEFVNRHFTLLNACVEAEAGVVAQFIGDSLMAFWGAPDLQPDHAARACRAALAIERALEADNRRRAARGEAPVRVRIGINTGEVTAGSVGAPGRSSYGIVGDTVNTTQRIEQLAKLVCLDQPTAAILVSSATRYQAGEGFRFEDAGAHPVRGRQEPVRIFRLEPPLEPVGVVGRPAPVGPQGGFMARRRERRRRLVGSDA